MKKKISIILIIIIGIVLIFAMGKNKSEIANNKEDKLNILATFYPVYIFTQNVVEGIDNIELKSLEIQANGCLHDYQLTVGNMKDIENADIIIINGAGMEKSFIDDVKDMYPNKIIVDTSKGVELLNNAHENEVNAHIWLSITNAKIQVKNIADALCSVDSENSYIYTENANKYVTKLDELDAEYQVDSINVVAMHDSVSYFAKDLGINVVEIVQNGEENVPSPKEIVEIIQKMRENNIEVILMEENYSEDRIATRLSDETGANIYYFNSITSGNGMKTEYIEKMKNNYDMIRSIK